MADFDFGALKPKATEAWSREGGGAPAKPVPENLMQALKASRANDQAGLFSVPGPAYERDDKGAVKVDAHDRPIVTGLAKELGNFLRRGAEQLNLGVRIKTDESENRKTAHVAFQATERRKHDPDKPRKPTRLKNETDPEYAARIANYERDLATWRRQHS
jgi:hypothetical protein